MSGHVRHQIGHRLQRRGMLTGHRRSQVRSGHQTLHRLQRGGVLTGHGRSQFRKGGVTRPSSVSKVEAC